MKNFYRSLVLSPIILIVSIQLSYSQWTLWPGSSGLIGLGVSPSVSVAGPNIVWFAGGTANSPKVYRTSNGTNLINATGNMTNTPELWCIWAVDSLTAFAGDGGAASGAGGNAKVWKTTNGGVNWSVILTTGGTVGFINSIVFSRTMPNVGIIESDPPTGAGGVYWLQKTTDGGLTWTLQNPTGVSGQASTQNGLVVIDDQFYAFGLGNSAPPKIRYTTNGGSTWLLRTVTGITGGFVSGLAISSDKQTWICATGDATGSSLPNIARSTDMGATWTTIATGTGITGYCSMKWVYTTNFAYLTGGAGPNGCSAFSSSGGLFWSPLSSAGVVGITNFDLFFTPSIATLYAIAVDGSCIKLMDNYNGIDPQNHEIPYRYVLQQNFPNPFNPSTTIKYSLPKTSYVTLKIYDMLGNEVLKVVDGQQAAGNYIEKVDASSLASGIYFYTLQAGDYLETKKMSLIK